MNRGFTLVELVLVMLLLGIVAVVIWPRASSREELTLQGRAEQLVSDIRYAQTLSMTTGARHCLLFEPTAGPPYSGYSLRSGAGCATAAAHPGGLLGTVSLCLSGACVQAPALANDYVQFDGRGVPYAGAAALASDAVVTIADAGGSRTVTITRNTGRVRVQ